MNLKDQTTFGGVFKIQVYENAEAKAKGIVKQEVEVHNKMTNASLAAITGLVGNTGSQNPFTYLELGTGNLAVSAAHTALQTPITDSGLARTTATVSRVTTTQTNDTLKLEYTWTASGTKTIAEIGIFNASSGGVMLARAVLSSTVAAVSGNLVNAIYTWKAVGN